MHSDLWTSSILSSAEHKYYILPLDDYTNFLLTFPIGKKYQVYEIFPSFSVFVKTQFEKNI